MWYAPHFITSGHQIVLSVLHHNLATGHRPFLSSFARFFLVKSRSFSFEDAQNKNHPGTPGQGYMIKKRGSARQNRCTQSIVIISEVKSPVFCIRFLQLCATYDTGNICPRFQLDIFGVELSRYLRMNHSLVSKTSPYICSLVIYLEQYIGLHRVAKVH